MMCMKDVSYSTVTYHKTHARSDRSDRKKIRALHRKLVLFLQQINCSRYIPENESVGDFLGWNKSDASDLKMGAFSSQECIPINSYI